MSLRRANRLAEPRVYTRGFFRCTIAMLAGCSGTVTPPTAPARPTVVYLCDYGYHSSLLLPVGDGRYVEYLFGDYEWAALNRTGVFEAIGAAFFSDGATLGRRYVRPAAGGPVRPLTVPVTQWPVTVDGDKCLALEGSLDARWQSHAGSAASPGQVGAFYDYVRDDEPYSLGHNCNRETADWLDALGCRTSGLRLLSHFTVESATAGGAK